MVTGKGMLVSLKTFTVLVSLNKIVAGMLVVAISQMMKMAMTIFHKMQVQWFDKRTRLQVYASSTTYHLGTTIHVVI